METASVALVQNGQSIDELLLRGLAKAGDNCIFACILYRENTFWSVVNVSDTGPGVNFGESEELIRNNLKHAGLDEVLLLETKEWSATKGKKFDLKKD